MLQDEVETSLLKQVPGKDRVIKHTSNGFEGTDFIVVAIVSTFWFGWKSHYYYHEYHDYHQYHYYH